MVDIAYKSPEANKFITNVGLITSNGPLGNDIMACEWTHHVSYSPGMIVISLEHGIATNENIKKSGEFGVSLASIGQNELSSVAGGVSGKDFDKVEALKELGHRFFKAKKINCLLVEDASLNVECKVKGITEAGDHTIFIGEAVETYPASGKEPLAYHGGKYYKLGEQIMKPEKEKLDKIERIVEKHKKMNN